MEHGVAARSHALVAGDRALGRPSYFRRKQHGAAAHGHPHTITSHEESGHRTPDRHFPGTQASAHTRPRLTQRAALSQLLLHPGVRRTVLDFTSLVLRCLPQAKCRQRQIIYRNVLTKSGTRERQKVCSANKQLVCGNRASRNMPKGSCYFVKLEFRNVTGFPVSWCGRGMHICGVALGTTGGELHRFFHFFVGDAT